MADTKQNIIIEIRNGMIEAIYGDGTKVHVSVIDHDNKEWEKDAHVVPAERLSQGTGDGYRFA